MKNTGVHTDELFSTQEKILYITGGILLLGGGFFFGHKLVQNALANREENNSIEEGAPATYAKQLRMAFENDGWPGTNTTELRRILSEIPSREVLDKVAKSYSKLFNRNLMRDLSDELQSSQYNEMLQIINAKPEKEGQPPATASYEGWAKRLRAAFEKEYGFMPGTDEEAIKAVFMEIPSQSAFLKTADAYVQLYGTPLTDDLKSELEFWEYSDYMSIITSKPL